MPRRISPKASARTLPCSADTISASSKRCSSSSSRNANITAARDEMEASRHPSHAVRATLTTASTSPGEAMGTAAMTLPATGSVTSNIVFGAPCVR